MAAAAARHLRVRVVPIRSLAAHAPQRRAKARDDKLGAGRLDDALQRVANSEQRSVARFNLCAPCADADAEKASRAWRETHELADLAIENATRMKRRAAEAVSLAKDLEAKSAKAKAVAQRTAHIAETALLKKRKHEEQEEDRKKRMATMQEEARKQNNEEARKYRRVAPSRKSSSTDGNEQQQPQERLLPRPPRFPPPGRTVSAGRS